MNQTVKGPQIMGPPPIADTDQQAAKELFPTPLIYFPWKILKESDIYSGADQKTIFASRSLVKQEKLVHSLFLV